MIGKRTGSEFFKPLLVLLACSTLVLLLIVLSGARWNLIFDTLPGQAASEEGAQRSGFRDASSTAITEPPKDKLLGGLLVPGFDEASCLSRYQAASYWKESSHKPSSHLLESLRKYEARHKKCGPNTELYKKATERLKSGNNNEPSDCNYVIWIAEAGLGNRLISLASAFLYAVLTDKVLLASIPHDLHGIFCEPFPETSWVLPSDFPLKHYEDLNPLYPQSLAKIIQEKEAGKNIDAFLSSYVYLHIMHDSSHYDKRFFCDEAQHLLKRVPWLVLRANVYFGPGLFLIPQFNEELNRLFPEKETVFHHLGRYLLHPTNPVWGAITRYYNSYLAHAKERLGLQIRVFSNFPVPFEDMLAQVVNCTLKEARVLPDVTNDEPVVSSTTGVTNLKSVLVTSLTLGYFEKLRNMYYERSTVSGELIAVFQPSHEEMQHTEQQNHNAKALAEMYLLSFNDALVTTYWSTFGYVAQSLGDMKPWIILRPGGRGPSCKPSLSIEPCFQNPPRQDCAGQNDLDAGSVLPYLRQCEDFPWGVKLVDSRSNLSIN